MPIELGFWHLLGFFGNQNSLAKPRVQRWAMTIARLKQRFNLPDPA